MDIAGLEGQIKRIKIKRVALTQPTKGEAASPTPVEALRRFHKQLKRAQRRRASLIQKQASVARKGKKSEASKS